jgi:gamma-glutamyltranspeptidase / glutathione hydrolase
MQITPRSCQVVRISQGLSLAILCLAISACAHNTPANNNIPSTVYAEKRVESSAVKAPAALPAAPEAASGYTPKPGWLFKRYAVAAAHPLAAQAGADIIQQGGSAVDAAIAVQMVLTLVEPQSSGIGGGAFLLHYDNKSDGKHVQAFDGRETAPMNADESLFIKDGKPMSVEEAVVGGRSVGAPGVVKMLQLAHQQHGKLAWKALFAPAIKLAQDGFALGPRLHKLLSVEKYLKLDREAAQYFYQVDGTPKPIGTLLQNPELALTFKEIAERGAEALEDGPIAWEIIAKVQQHPTNPGKLTGLDLEKYQAKVREPVCTVYRIYRVCGMPPPSSGGIAIAQMLGMLSQRNITTSSPVNGMPTEDSVHLMAEISKRAYADRNQYVADTDFILLPGGSALPMINMRYLIDRGASISTHASGRAQAGVPEGARVSYAADASLEPSGTSHISIVDANGNAVSMTSTIEDQFGSRQMVRGFLLNNQLTDFSFISMESGNSVEASKPIANRVQPGKRPRSSMSPVLVFNDKTNELLMSTGSPGGSAIINYVAKTLIGTLDWGLDVQRAIDLPNFGSRNLGDKGALELEKGRFPQATIDALKARGHDVREIEQTSGVHGIMRTPNGWYGGADPRREGIVAGQ